MSKLTERKDLLIKEAEALQGQFKEASETRQKAEKTCQDLAAQFNDKTSRINELESLIEDEKTDVEEVEACPA
tara:strand:+ start:121 stop:339 length:219 start_codon:yes stop_codon:yes gene_type:complete